jgi:hypothetical protein
VSQILRSRERRRARRRPRRRRSREPHVDHCDGWLVSAYEEDWDLRLPQ